MSKRVVTQEYKDSFKGFNYGINQIDIKKNGVLETYFIYESNDDYIFGTPVIGGDRDKLEAFTYEQAIKCNRYSFMTRDQVYHNGKLVPNPDKVEGIRDVFD